MKRFITTFLLVVLLLAGCGADVKYADPVAFDGITTNGISSSSSINNDDYNYTETEDNKQDTLSSEKIVYTCSLRIETTSYTEDLKYIHDTVKAYNGIVEYESETDSNYQWYYLDSVKTTGTLRNHITVRIPADNYESFLNFVGSTGRVVGKESRADNISQSYYDTTSTIPSLKIQEERLLSMYEDAYTIEDMIMVENRLTEVQSQLNLYQTRLANMDTDVQYATVNIELTEVVQYTPTVEEDTFWNRLSDTVSDTIKEFLSTLEDLLFLCIRVLPYVPIMLLLGWLTLRTKKKK